MLGRRHELSRLQSDFYRDQFRKILRWLVVSIVMIVALLLVIAYLVLFRPPIRYYANTIDGQILEMPQPKIMSTS
jgi:hypothetical protein